MDPDDKEQLNVIRSDINRIYGLLCKIENEYSELARKLEAKKMERSPS